MMMLRSRGASHWRGWIMELFPSQAEVELAMTESEVRAVVAQMRMSEADRLAKGGE